MGRTLLLLVLSTSLCAAWVAQAPLRPSIVSSRRAAAAQIQAQAPEQEPAEEPTGMTPERRRFEVEGKGFLCERLDSNRTASAARSSKIMHALCTAHPCSLAPSCTHQSPPVRSPSLRLCTHPVSASVRSLPGCDSEDRCAGGHAGLLLKVSAAVMSPLPEAPSPTPQPGSAARAPEAELDPIAPPLFSLAAGRTLRPRARSG